MKRKKSDPIAEVHCLVNKLCARKCSVHIVELEISSPASKHLPDRDPRRSSRWELGYTYYAYRATNEDIGMKGPSYFLRGPLQPPAYPPVLLCTRVRTSHAACNSLERRVRVRDTGIQGQACTQSRHCGF